MHVYCVHVFDHVVFLAISDTLAGQGCPHSGPTIKLTHIRGPTIQTYEGPQGPGTMLLKSGTVPEIRGPLRPMSDFQRICCRKGEETPDRMLEKTSCFFYHNWSTNLAFEQCIELPRVIALCEGTPNKGSKSSTTTCLEERYQNSTPSVILTSLDSN